MAKIMRSLTIKEISGVDRPAQQGARAVILKRAPDDPVEEFAKASFQQAFDETMFDRRFCQIFYEAFDGKWAADEAFQQALKDGYSNSEETVRQYVETIAAMAQRAAEATRGLAKSADGGKAAITKAVGDAVDEFLESQQEETDMFKYSTKAALKAAIAKFAKGEGSDQDRIDIQTSAIALGEAALLTGDLVVGAPAPDNSGEVETLKRDIAVLKLGPAAKAHFDGLTETEQTAFLAKSAEDQQADIDKAAEAAKGDPIVFKAKDGTVIRKSDGAVALMMAKRFDQLDERLEKMEASSVGDRFAKRAAAEFGALPEEGTVELLKAAEAEPDEKKRKAMLDTLRAAQKAAGGRFQRIGGGASAPGNVAKSTDIAKAEDRLDEMAKAYAADHGISFEKAYQHVMSTPEGEQAYLETIDDDRFPAE